MVHRPSGRQVLSSGAAVLAALFLLHASRGLTSGGSYWVAVFGAAQAAVRSLSLLCAALTLACCCPPGGEPDWRNVRG